MKLTRRRIITMGVATAVLAISITSLAPGVSVRKLVKKEVSKQIDKATGPTGPAGATGATGAAGSARAFAFVDHFDCNAPPNDPCDPDPSQGVASVTHVSAGVYCAVVPGLSPTTSPSVASADTAQSFPGNASNEVRVNGLDSGACPLGQYEFLTFDPAGDPSANVDTSFTFVIP